SSTSRTSGGSGKRDTEDELPRRVYQRDPRGEPTSASQSPLGLTASRGTPPTLSRWRVETYAHAVCPGRQAWSRSPRATSSVPSGVHAVSASVLPSTAAVSTL